MRQVERRLTTILAADIVGYSRLMGADEVATLDEMKAHRDELIEPKLSAHHGRTIKLMGDGMLVEFASVVQAVEFAIDMQRSVRERNAAVAEDRRLVYRIGINLGDVIVDGDDIYGDGVNVAARLEALAEPGGICVRRNVRDEVRDKLAVGFDDLGEIEVKNIARPVRCFALRFDGDGGGAVRHAAPAAAAVSEKPAIAVLPFANMSADTDQDYFADGVVDEIITGLARIRWLTVIARNSTFAYKGASPDIRQVGRDLAVRYVVEGSVRKAGNSVRITAQLADAGTGGHLWADRFTGALDDIFDLQDQVTVGVVAAIEPSVRQAEIERAKRKRPDSLDAYDLYLRALEQSYVYSPAARSAGLALLDKAIAIDPDYAEAHGVAAFCLQQQYLWGGRSAADREAALCHAEAVMASRTDDATALAFAALALSSLDARHDVALVMVERALGHNPNSATAHNVSALIKMIVERPQDSIAHAQAALRLSPFDPLRHLPECVLAVVSMIAGEHEAALERVRRGLEANPLFTPGLTLLAICLVRLGRVDEARATVRRIVETAPDTRVATLPERFLFANSLGVDRVVADLREVGLPD